MKKLGYKTTDYAFTYSDISSFDETNSTVRGIVTGVTREYSIAVLNDYISLSGNVTVPDEIPVVIDNGEEGGLHELLHGINIHRGLRVRKQVVLERVVRGYPLVVAGRCLRRTGLHPVAQSDGYVGVLKIRHAPTGSRRINLPVAPGQGHSHRKGGKKK